MAVTSIWRVHGRVGKVLDYVENAEKTTAVSTGDSDLSDVIDYCRITGSYKTWKKP